MSTQPALDRSSSTEHRRPSLTPTSASDATLARELVLARIREDSRFLLATHEAPDGDAIGSLIALHGLLTSLGKDATMLIDPADQPLPGEYRFLASEHPVQEPPTDIAQRTVVLLDCGSSDRNPTAALRDGAHLLNIDHHHDNTRFGTINYVDADASCTAEIVWDLMHELEVPLTPAIAEALYVALITDTGLFMYSNTSPTAHRMAAELIEAGVDVPLMYRRVHEEQPVAKLALLAIALGQLHRYDNGQLALASLSAADFKRAHADDIHSEGIIDHLRSLQCTKVAVLSREVCTGERRVSLRASDHDVDVSLIARAQGGGGHRQAAGFSTTLPEHDMIEFLRNAVDAQLHSPRPLTS
jgi:bifunctional oligoribonuclease and PAP phosphatase NrnA